MKLEENGSKASLVLGGGLATGAGAGAGVFDNEIETATEEVGEGFGVDKSPKISSSVLAAVTLFTCGAAFADPDPKISEAVFAAVITLFVANGLSGSCWVVVVEAIVSLKSLI